MMNNPTDMAAALPNRTASVAWLTAELASVLPQYAATLWCDYHCSLDSYEAYGVALQISVERDLAARRLEQVIWSVE